MRQSRPITMQYASKQTTQTLINKGNTLYDHGKLEAAIEEYNNAISACLVRPKRIPAWVKFKGQSKLNNALE